MNTRHALLLSAAAALLAAPLCANVKVNNIFSDNMVIPRDRPVTVWGTADAGEAVTVTFADQTVTATADKDGSWEAKLAPLAASKEDRDLAVAGKNKVTFKNVLVGDVWLCGGQSNMEFDFSWGVIDGEAVMKDAASHPAIRHVKIGRESDRLPRAQAPVARGGWHQAAAEMNNVTATGYFFARRLNQDLDVPIGILADNWSGSLIEPFIAPAGYRAVPGFEKQIAVFEKFDPATAAGKAFYAQFFADEQKWIDAAKASIAAGKPVPEGEPRLPGLGRGDPCGQFFAMIAPLARFPVKGVIWYQGESNANDPDTAYAAKMLALATGWRQAWGYDFPFYFVQVAGYGPRTTNAAGGDGYAALRNAQRLALGMIPNSGMAVAFDLGDDKNIHPKDKLDVGERLARWALAKDYGKDVVCSGPIFKAATPEGAKIRVSFDHVAPGLMVGSKSPTDLKPTTEVKDGKLEGFSIAGADKNWFVADAVIDGDTVVVSSPSVATPVAVRYAYRGNPMGHANLYNKAGLPAAPFRSDNW